MPQQNPSIADEVEAAIAASTAKNCADTVERVTALFLASAGRYSDEQLDLFENVFERLVNTIELRAIADVGAQIALAQLSQQLAAVPQAPAGIIRRLAQHEQISVAAPVLAESPRLSDGDLIEIAGSASEQHLIAIAGRWWLQEIVTDKLLARRFPSVSHRLVSNPGARVSAAGFALIVAQAIGDPELAVVTGIRADLPADLRAKLLGRATQEVRGRLLERAPPHLFEEIRAAVAAASAGVERDLSRERDFAGARATVSQLKKEGRLDEAALLTFAKQRRYEETVAALAELSGSTIEMVRPLMQSLRSDGILIPCKVAALGWETVHAVLDCRFSSGITAADELAKLGRQFSELTRDHANRLYKLWMVRAIAPAHKPR